MNFTVFIIVIAVFAASCTAKKKDAFTLLSELDQSARPNILSKKEKNKGWTLLFDGSTTKGWRGFNMGQFPDCWTIEDGTLTMTTTGMQESLDIITEKIYQNFALSLEFKLSPGANSGILYQVSEGESYQFPYETGPEYQVIDHDNWPDPLEDWQICGSNYAMYPPLEKPYKPVGEWNHIFLLVDDNKVEQLLNGKLIVRYEKYSEEWMALRNSGKWSEFPDYGKYDKGHIALQNHGTKVWYRNIKIKAL